MARWAVSGAAMLCLLLADGCDRGAEPSAAASAAAAAARGLDRARRERTLNLLEQLRTALTRYAIDHEGAFPEGPSLAGISAELSPRYVPRLEPVDAWGNVMTYSSDGRSYAIVSAGPDGVSGSQDDLTLRDGAVSGGR